jgi:hypothetical protein
LFVIQTETALVTAIFAVIDGAPAMLIAVIAPETL